MPLLRTFLVCAAAILALQAQAAEKPRPHNVILFVPDGLRALSVTPESRANDGVCPRQGRQLQEFPLAVPDLHDRECVRVRDRSLLGRHRRLQQRHLTGHPIAGRGRQRHTLSRKRSRPWRGRPALRRRLPQRGDGPQGGARGWASAPRPIGKVGPVLIFDHTERTGEQTIIVDDCDRHCHRHPALATTSRPR